MQLITYWEWGLEEWSQAYEKLAVNIEKQQQYPEKQQQQ